MAQSLQARLKDDLKSAMRSREKARLGVLRLISAAVKQREVDNRIDLDDAGVLEVLTHMVKSRRDSVVHYTKAGRSHLIEQETKAMNAQKHKSKEKNSERDSLWENGGNLQ